MKPLKRNFKRTIGILLISAPFVLAFVTLVVCVGIWVTLLFYAVAVFITFMIISGVNLLDED